jgi:hypothetical protein
VSFGRPGFKPWPGQMSSVINGFAKSHKIFCAPLLYVPSERQLVHTMYVIKNQTHHIYLLNFSNFSKFRRFSKVSFNFSKKEVVSKHCSPAGCQCRAGVSLL